VINEVSKYESSTLKIIHFNIQGLGNKMLQLESYVSLNNIKILCLNEHWLQEDDLISHTLPGFTLAAKFCRRVHIHGGTAIFVANDIATKEVCFLELCTEIDFEICVTQIDSYSMIVVSIYRSPAGNMDVFLDSLETVLERLSRLKEYTIIICSDFNIDVRVRDNKTSKFECLLRQFGLFCKNFSPTRGRSCIDNIVTNREDWDFTINVENLCMGDHLALLMEVNVLEELNSLQGKFQKRLLSEARLVEFRTRLKAWNWKRDLDCMTVEEAMTRLLNTVKCVFDICCPAISKKVRKSKNKKTDWFTPHLHKIRNLMLAYHTRYAVSKSDLAKCEYMKIKKMYRKELSLAKKTSWEKCISNAANKCKAAWDLVRTEAGHKTTAPKPNVSPDFFNSFFSRSIEEIKSKIPISATSFGDIDSNKKDNMESDCGSALLQVFKWKDVSANEICCIVKRLNNSKSHDVYGLNHFILRYVIDVLAEPLAVLYNRMFKEGIFPQCLKISRTIPLYKKGDRLNVSNYRPISIVPVLSKIFESLMKSQLYYYLESNKLWSEDQFGFRSGRSTEAALLEITSSIYESFEKKHFVSVTAFDLSRAFECIDHEIIYKKLLFYGLNEMSAKLIKSFLSDRRQIVDFNGQNSSPMDVECGVPQGSVLGPILFLIAVNDLPKNIPCRSVLFADDTTILMSDSNLETLGMRKEEAIRSASEWFSSNNLYLNSSKTQNIIFSLRKVSNELESIKVLGVSLDPKLSWNIHIAELCLKLSRVLFLLRRLKELVSSRFLRSLYFSFFHVHMLYGLRLWGNASDASLVFGVQRKAIRILKGLPFAADCKEAFIELRILTLPSLYILSCLNSVKLNLNNYQLRSNKHNYQTRNRNDIDIPACRLNKKFRSFGPQSIKLFNKLPLTIRSKPFNCFKRVMHRTLIMKAYYSTEAFINDDLSDLR
jgi:hypothetical protein